MNGSMKGHLCKNPLQEKTVGNVPNSDSLKWHAFFLKAQSKICTQ